jgi:hypothetical protein
MQPPPEDQLNASAENPPKPAGQYSPIQDILACRRPARATSIAGRLCSAAEWFTFPAWLWTSS